MAGLFACSTVAESPNYDDEAGFPPAYGEEAIQSQPNAITFSALDFDQPYSRLAVGNVARGVSEPGCCFDYLLGGPAADDVRVVFGGGSNDGLTFLADRPDELLALGGMDDVLLVDLDEDGRNDLLGLRPQSGHEVVVRLGVSMPGPDGPFLLAQGVGTSTMVSLQGSMAIGYGDFAAGDLDCDGHVDLAITAPTTGSVVILPGRGDGSFRTPDSSSVDVDLGRGSVRVLVAQLDGEGGDDIATANNDGSMTVLLANGCTGEFLDRQRHALKPVSNVPCENPTFCWDDTDTAVIASGDFCSPPGLDLAYAFEEQIWIMCGSAGEFGAVGEQSHGGSVAGAPAADYFFDLDGPSGISPNGQIDDTLVWEDELYVLRVPPGVLALQDTLVLGSHRLVRLGIEPDQVAQGIGEPVLTLFTETPRILLHPAAIDDSTLRLVWPALGMARWEQP